MGYRVEDNQIVFPNGKRHSLESDRIVDELNRLRGELQHAYSCGYYDGATDKCPDNYIPGGDTLKLILMRGLPGSGKSTKAKTLAEAAKAQGLSVGIYSTDEYFMQGDRYVFNPDKIGEAHAWNRERVEKALRDGQDVVIVDNTNTTLWECENYFKLALAAGYEVEIQEPDSSWWLENRHLLGTPTVVNKDLQDRYADLLVSKNTHGVPKAGILKMMVRWETVAVPH